MKQLYIKSARKILQNKPKLEESLKIKINVRNQTTTISGKEVDEFVAEQVLEALDLGFDIDDALLLRDENYIFEKINIKDYTHSKNLEAVRARIIGTKGKTITIIEDLSGCLLSLKDNDVGLIGRAEDMPNALQALKSIISGSKQGHVYARLERLKKQVK